MKVIIIDDNVKAAEELRQRLGEYPDITVEGVAHNGFDGLSLVGEFHPDVLFLDVEMPGISGLDFLDRVGWIHNKRCRVVMYTAFADYILPAMRKLAFDVLLKPIVKTELDTIVERLRAVPADIGDEKNAIKEYIPGKLLLYTNSVDFRVIDKADVGLFQYSNEMRCWEALVVGRAKPVHMKRSIKAETVTALDDQFVQVSQRFIVNMNYLIEVVDGCCRFFPPFDKIDYVTVGRLYRRRLTKKFFSL